ncbi:MAG: YgfZ/GcvT domain-containing protein [Gaiellaceae bacterium]
MDVAARPRAFVRVAGPDARDYLQRMVSNDVDALEAGGACPALLLTAKARLIAPLVVWRRGADDYLLLTEPELGETVRAHLARMRLRAHCEVEPEEHVSALVFGGEGIPTDFPGAVEVLDSGLEPTISEEELELRRIEAAVPRWGRELDDSILPAEAGLDRTHISFSKGCYPGQEPIARLHYRGHVNRSLQVVELDDDAQVERVTSRARRPDGSVVALAYVRSRA